MKKLLFYLFIVGLLSGCRAGKSAVEPPGSVAISQADSIKYEAVKEAFLNCDFVFKISRIGNQN